MDLALGHGIRRQDEHALDLVERGHRGGKGEESNGVKYHPIAIEVDQIHREADTGSRYLSARKNPESGSAIWIETPQMRLQLPRRCIHGFYACSDKKLVGLVINAIWSSVRGRVLRRHKLEGYVSPRCRTFRSRKLSDLRHRFS